VSLLLSVLIALLLDKLLGEPRRWHPLVGFGNLVSRIEAVGNKRKDATAIGEPVAFVKMKGVVCWCLAVLPLTVLAVSLEAAINLWADNNLWVSALISGGVLYLAIGWQSLLEHALNVAKPLSEGNLSEARQAVAMIVSRDTQQLNETQIAKAATESVLENGGDAIFSALFWFIVAGIPGVVLYRLANTLDAMWGYKSERFINFGWAAARIDDLLNFIPARLTAASYALVGNTALAWRCWRQQGYSWKSPNAGPVMASGAGALNVALGGVAQYHDKLQQRPSLGPSLELGEAPSAKSIEQSCGLVNRALLLWVSLLLFLVTAVEWIL
jgi:adenosylcobinamide-phosphate synthase